MQNPIDILKILPNGRRVYRTIEKDDFLSGGWVTQGWAASDADGPEINEEAYKIYDDKEFQKLVQGKSTEELRDYMVPVTIIKQLPNGKWASRRVFKGEFLTKGWKQNGWIQRATQMRQWGPRAKYGRKKVLNDLKKQRWWRPKRSLAYTEYVFDYNGRPGLTSRDSHRQHILNRDRYIKTTTPLTRIKCHTTTIETTTPTAIVSTTIPGGTIWPKRSTKTTIKERHKKEKSGENNNKVIKNKKIPKFNNKKRNREKSKMLTK